MTAGALRVDGIDVRELSLSALWASIGLVPQQAYLFSGSIASNLRLGQPEASDDALWAALEVAQTSDFVKALPKGLLSPVAQGGAIFRVGRGSA